MHRKLFLSLSGFLLFASVLTVHAQRDDGPPARNFAGTWILYQENNFTVTVNVTQKGRDITGTASYNAGRRGIARGTVTGKAFFERNRNGIGDVDHFEIEIAWHDGVGIYQATTPFGKSYLKGQTWPKGNPNGKVGWYTTQGFGRR